MGSAPIAPMSSVQLITVNSSSIILDLAAWMDGGCPITSFVVEYQKIRSAIKPLITSENVDKEKSLTQGVTISFDEHPYSEDNEWILVNNNVKPHSTGKEGDVLLDGIDKSDSHARREISKNNN